jgi:hypothetical protein
MAQLGLMVPVEVQQLALLSTTLPLKSPPKPRTPVLPDCMGSDC